MTKEQIAVSIIIPIYNVENYLKQCLESVISQTLKNIEIICIDDGSTDLSPSIIDEYGKKDERICVFHRKNAGYGNVVNFGIAQAKGKYIGIVESDDFVMPEMFESLYEVAERDNLEFVKSDYYLYSDEKKIKVHMKELDNYYNKIITKTSRNVLYKMPMYNWSGIYRTDFIRINQINHLESPGASYQDTGFWFKMMSVCDKAMWIDKAFYFYRQDNPNSSVKSKEKMYAYFNEYESIEKYLLDRNLEKEWRISNFYRMLSHRATFYRIFDQNKLEYANLIKVDYQKRKNTIDWNVNQELIRELKDFMERISDSPEQFVFNYIDSKEAAFKRLDTAKSLVLYGAGIRGEKVYQVLQENGYLDKLRFVIDNFSPHVSFKGKTIVRFKESSIGDDDLVLVAVSNKTKSFQQIINGLKNNSIENYLETEKIIGY